MQSLFLSACDNSWYILQLMLHNDFSPHRYDSFWGLGRWIKEKKISLKSLYFSQYKWDSVSASLPLSVLWRQTCRLDVCQPISRINYNLFFYATTAEKCPVTGLHWTRKPAMTCQDEPALLMLHWLSGPEHIYIKAVDENSQYHILFFQISR